MQCWCPAHMCVQSSVVTTGQLQHGHGGAWLRGICSSCWVSYGAAPALTATGALQPQTVCALQRSGWQLLSFPIASDTEGQCCGLSSLVKPQQPGLQRDKPSLPRILAQHPPAPQATSPFPHRPHPFSAPKQSPRCPVLPSPYFPNPILHNRCSLQAALPPCMVPSTLRMGDRT